MDWLWLIVPIGGLLVGLAAAVSLRHSGRRDAERDAIIKDAKHARTIQEKADAARAVGGDVDDRLSKHGAYRGD